MTQDKKADNSECETYVTTKLIIDYYKSTWTSELSGNIFRKVLLPLLQNKILTYDELVNLSDEVYCKNNFGIPVPLINDEQKAPFYVDKFKNRNHEYYAYKEWNKEQKEYLVNWIIENNVTEEYHGNRWEALSSNDIITKVIAPLVSEDILDKKVFIELQNPITCKKLFCLQYPIFPSDNYNYRNREGWSSKVTIKNNFYYYNDELNDKQKQLLIYYLSDKIGADNIQNYYETVCSNYKPCENPTRLELKVYIDKEIGYSEYKNSEVYLTTATRLLETISYILANSPITDEDVNNLLSPNPKISNISLSKPLLRESDERDSREIESLRRYFKDKIVNTEYTTINGKIYAINYRYSIDEKEQLINWVLLNIIGKEEVPTPKIEIVKPKVPVFIPPRVRRIINTYSSETDDDLAASLQKMGKAWFVTYAYYIYKDYKYHRWELAGTLPLRISYFKKSMVRHFKWLKEIANDTTANYRTNQVDLNTRQIVELAKEILDVPENERYENCSRLL